MEQASYKKIKIAAINANSIGTIKRRYDLQTFIDQNEIDICLISETKLNAKHKVQLSNHQLVRTDRPNSTKGGGTAIAIHSKLKFTTIHFPNSSKNKVIDIYATQSNGQKFIHELAKLMKDFKLDTSNNYYLIAGDFNAKSTSWGDMTSNDRGDKLIEWMEAIYVEYKATLLSPKSPTFPKAKSFLDHCIMDMRIDIENLENGKLPILPYDSDHWAITLTISTDDCAPGLLEQQDTHLKARNFKKANWVKFRKHLLNNYDQDIKSLSDHNLSIEEIDNHIEQLESIITNSIKATIPLIKKIEDYFLKYNNKSIKRLHAYKSYLIRRQFDNIPISNQEKSRIKLTIKRINKLIHKEFKNTVTAYWEAQTKSINYKNPQKFFPKINRMLRPKKDISINTLKIPMDNSTLSNHCSNKFPELVNNNEIIATDPDTKLHIIGKYLESINAPRYTNLGTITKLSVDTVATDIKKIKDNMRTTKGSFVDFSTSNPAHYPVTKDNEPKFLFSYIEVLLILQKLKNKTSAGLDNIPTIVLKNLPELVIKHYTIIFNNAINLAYYPQRWKVAKVLPIPKKDKNIELPQSYRPISLTMESVKSLKDWSNNNCTLLLATKRSYQIINLDLETSMQQPMQ
ncbi:uncharacterized protein LOC130663506 [Microplitis mediator]|uniref:uncharacterized protein LOC130663506 n=1 Tax=Microplitis mediator TaxID=375433 RepID=UPI002552F007|nr:uncharacterized protein LOC130663506 [Microplitis mediator]